MTNDQGLTTKDSKHNCPCNYPKAIEHQVKGIERALGDEMLGQFCGHAQGYSDQCGLYDIVPWYFATPVLLPEQENNEQKGIKTKMAQVICAKPIFFIGDIWHMGPVRQSQQGNEPGEEKGGKYPAFGFRGHLLYC